MKNIIYNCVDRVVLNVQLFMLYLMMIHLSDTHIIIHVGLFFYVVLISFTVCHGRCYKMVGAGRERGLRSSIPDTPLRRA